MPRKKQNDRGAYRSAAQKLKPKSPPDAERRNKRVRSKKDEEREKAARSPTAFVASGERHEQLPTHGLPELAVIGRSNVGKSSLLGAVLKKPNLVRTSKTPGRTQLLNLFRFENRLALVDLPGYGFARLSKKQRDQLSVMVRDYLAERDGLRGVVVLMDARRDGPSEDDYRVVEWISEHQRPILIVLTKIDLVPKNRRLTQIRRFERAFALDPGAVLTFSATSLEGRDELLRQLLEFAQ